MPSPKPVEVKRKITARIHGVRKHGWFAGMHWRPDIRRQLLKARAGDKKRTWSKSFDAGLFEIKKDYYGIDLLQEIRHDRKINTRKPPYTVLELGCGTGRLPSELIEGLGEGVRMIASGVRREAQWSVQPNSSKIDWKVMHAEGLSKRLKAESVDFINSNLAMSHTRHINRALKECHKILKRGGKLLFTTVSYENIHTIRETLRNHNLFRVVYNKPTPIGDPARLICLEKL